MGDMYIKVLLIVLFAGTLGWALFIGLSPKTRGAWDERTRLIAQLRKEKISHKDIVKDARLFLIGEQPDVSLWPFLVNAAAHDAMSGRSAQNWRSARVLVGEQDAYQVITVDSPLLADGSEKTFGQILCVTDSFTLPVGFMPTPMPVKASQPLEASQKRWSFYTTQSPAELHEDSALLEWANSQANVVAIYTNGNTASAIIPAQDFDSELVAEIKTIKSALAQIVKL
ncbi:hypothetical protein JOD55_001105 [Arcanobacterium pluranimalium]|uniref:hypothetical protein n=1 Tax=Arcanobacterium pluranimalium TaxID=108028 RepID=UPI001956FABA|nr:hypothetical protein [Arcanobacterium pluranimalium]MBM7825278.1 hypothetical protein [Arcanobacterium pluranimalium]